jgi:hypothetical protein
MTDLKGRCLCGAVTWEATGPMKWQAICHCESCRRAASSPMVGWFGVYDAGLRWSGPLQRYASSKGVERGFCGTCGSPMFFRNPSKWPDETHLYGASLDDPTAYAPSAHVHYDEHLPWGAMADGLPRHGADGEALDEA